MTDQKPIYKAFMLRVWRKSRGSAEDLILFELEHVHSHLKKRFSTWEDLQLYMKQHIDDGGIEIVDHGVNATAGDENGIR